MREHITEEALLDFVDQRVDATTAALIQAHLSTGCEKCHASLAIWNRLLPAIQADRLPGAPPYMLARAFDLFRAEQKAVTLKSRILAALTFDSRLQAMPVGARDLERDSVKLVYTASDLDIDLMFDRIGSTWNLSGQVFTEQISTNDWSIFAVSEVSRWEVHSDPLGEFHIKQLAGGRYVVTLQDESREVVLPEITL